MKKISKILLMFILFFLFMQSINAKEVNVYMFYGEGCPHCEAAYEYLQSVDKYKLNIYRYEVFNNEENKTKLNSVAEYLDVNVTGVPFVVINNKPISGYSEKITNSTYNYNIKLASNDEFIDKVGIKLGVIEKQTPSSEKKIVSDKKELMNIFKVISLNILNPSIIWILLIAMIIFSFVKKNQIYKMIYLFMMLLFYILYVFKILDFNNIVNVVIISRMIISLFLILFGAYLLNKGLDSKGQVNLNSYASINVAIIYSFLSVILMVYTSSVDPLIISEYDVLSIVKYFICFILFLLLVMILCSIITNRLNKFKYKNIIIGIVLILFSFIVIVKPGFLF